jgi:hypothetical protein
MAPHHTEELAMTISDSGLFLCRVLLADATLSGASGLLLLLGGSALAGTLGLPPTLLRGAGMILLPFAALVAWIATREPPPRAAVWAVIAGNALWAVDSVALLATGWVAPTALGYAFVTSQALAVALLAGLQRLGLRRLGGRAAATGLRSAA